MRHPSLRRLRGTINENLLSKHHYKCECTKGRVKVYMGTDADGGRTEVHCNRCYAVLRILTVIPLTLGDIGV